MSTFIACLVLLLQWELIKLVMGRSFVLTAIREPKLLVNFVFCLEKHSLLHGYYFMLPCRSETFFP